MFESIAHAFQEGGFGMYLIAISSVFIIAVAVERIHFLYFKATIEKDAFVQASKYICSNVGKALQCAKPLPLIEHQVWPRQRNSQTPVQAYGRSREVPPLKTYHPQMSRT